jgi:hypothetical protein
VQNQSTVPSGATVAPQRPSPIQARDPIGTRAGSVRMAYPPTLTTSTVNSAPVGVL